MGDRKEFVAWTLVKPLPFMIREHRDSSVELLRVALMLLIVAHHYVLHSGLYEQCSLSPMRISALTVLVLGAWGKIAINCFVLVTGYYMSRRELEVSKVFRLYAHYVFYSVVILACFCAVGRVHLTPRFILDVLAPVKDISSSFVPAYLAFLLITPFLNILVDNVTKSQFQRLIVLLLLVFSCIPSVPIWTISFNYIEWFSVVYLIGAYLRLYSPEIMTNRCLCAGLLGAVVVGVSVSVIAIWFFDNAFHKHISRYFFVYDCNKLLAVFASVVVFVWFKNLQLGYYSWINKIAGATFGVYLIHGNCAAMRQWLWVDSLHCTAWFDSGWLVVHMLGSVIGVFVVCSILELFRRKVVGLMKFVLKIQW